MITISAIFTISNICCERFLDTTVPNTSISSGNVYSNDATAAAVLTGIYTKISSANGSYGLFRLNGLSVFGGLLSDELTLYDLNSSNFINFYQNKLNAQNISADYWGGLYNFLFYVNSAIEGLENAPSLTPPVRQQLMGEAKFLRAFFHFLLVNLYGNACLSTTSDYQINTTLSRTEASTIYEQIVKDLKDAKNLLRVNYVDGSISGTSTERVRPNLSTAEALLARVYLYMNDYADAELEATNVIHNGLYDIVPLNDVFKKNSSETIWALQPVGSGTKANTIEGRTFILSGSGPNSSSRPVYCSQFLLNAFEDGDKRKEEWLGNISLSNDNTTTTYYYPYKYKIGAINTSTQEYQVIFRLSEMYLIRAEAKAKQEKFTEAQADLNTIRNRASLPNDNSPNIEILLTNIAHERQVELFAEWGHRWFDLKRTKAVDEVMGMVTPIKGGTWQSDWQFLPILANQLRFDPNLTQTQGY
ncbi:hypothetical protein BW716_06120 [[Flexibacter] sp. ATCC 35208]|nr:hypothetical protein BW716_06120 [[Flexibacter] sp. ATCC 35208]